MQLTEARVTNFRSIEDSTPVVIDDSVTVLVGQNESGKTAFLKALQKSGAIKGEEKFNVTEDYPRKRLTEFEAGEGQAPAEVLSLAFSLDEDEIKSINNDLGVQVFTSFSFRRTTRYNGSPQLFFEMSSQEKAYVQHLLESAAFNASAKGKLDGVVRLRELIEKLGALDLNEVGKAKLEELKAKFTDQNENRWNSLFEFYVWTKHIDPIRPKFLYFDDYMLLPGKVNLPTLQQRVAEYATNKAALTAEDHTVLALLRLAKVDLKDLISPSGYEKSKARLEGISNSITDKVFKFWTQNQELEVQFDIKDDPSERPPFNAGNNLYIRIRNQRHRVSVSFDQRSKGFIWFFSFLVWFDSIKQNIETDKGLILLLDEPGLSLHALAQRDFLAYIDELAKKHQIIYSTHSPFMVHSDRLKQVRMVEDRLKEGTKVTSEVALTDSKTIFPLQAALGYTIAQNLFISKKNLLVEGPADLLYLQYFSSAVAKKDGEALDEEITVVPAGGLDKVATFVALLGANQLELSVLHDYDKRPDPRLESLVREKIIKEKQVLNYGIFRDGAKKTDSATWISSDVEDLITPGTYLKLFNAAYKDKLGGVELDEAKLPAGDRIVDRINKFLLANAIVLRPSGGFNHYLVANYLVSNPLPASKLDKKTLERFERLFMAVNKLYD